MFLDIFAEEGSVGESETVADLLDAEVSGLEIVAYVFLAGAHIGP